MVSQNGLRLVNLPDYGPAFLVTARCGPACRVVWAGGGSNSLPIPLRRFADIFHIRSILALYQDGREAKARLLRPYLAI